MPCQSGGMFKAIRQRISYKQALTACRSGKRSTGKAAKGLTAGDFRWPSASATWIFMLAIT